MADVDKLKICIDREQCIGDSACVNVAPETFDMDDDDLAFVKEGSTDERSVIVDAANACPIDIISIVDKETGEKLAPEE